MITYLICVQCGRWHEMLAEDDKHLDRMLTGTGIRLLCSCGHTGCWLWSEQEFPPAPSDLPEIRARWCNLRSARIRADIPKSSPPGIVPSPGFHPEIAS